MGAPINLAFDLGDNVYIFGLGTAFEPIGAGNCGKALAAPSFSPDDTGTWLAGSAVSRKRLRLRRNAVHVLIFAGRCCILRHSIRFAAYRVTSKVLPQFNKLFPCFNRLIG